MISKIQLMLLLIWLLIGVQCEGQIDPDPWNIVSDGIDVHNNIDIPPDLQPTQHKVTKKKPTSDNVLNSEWFFRRLLSIVLKGGRTEKNEDDSVEVSLQMRFDPKKWDILVDYTKSNSVLSEDVLRRSIGYVEEAIYKPSITEKIAMAWSDHVQVYLTEYKVYITWTFGLLGAILALIKLWNHMSHRHFIIIIVCLLYLYEVFVSYKEAEQEQLDKFLSAINKCKWYFWTSNCDTPAPDPLIFIKHLNPLKIGIRMFTTIISEPVLVINDTMKSIVLDITDDLWFPLNKIVYGIMITTFNILIFFVFIMIIFNYILNIPINLSFFGLGFGVKQRRRTLFTSHNNSVPSEAIKDSIGGANLEKFLEICAHAISSTTRDKDPIRASNALPAVTLRRSASAGRLSSMNNLINNNLPALENKVRKRKNLNDGSGDTN